jgi:hypothetical protein
MELFQAEDSMAQKTSMTLGEIHVACLSSDKLSEIKAKASKRTQTHLHGIQEAQIEQIACSFPFVSSEGMR